MEIKAYREAKKIEKKYFSSLVDSEIECWWQSPFDEFLICKNESCRSLFSIEDVYENLENYRNRQDDKLSKDFKCNSCWSDTEFMYEKEKFMQIIKEYVKWKVSAVLLIDDNDKVEWFGVLAKWSLEKIINYELATRGESSYDYDKLFDILKNKRYSWDISLLHQIYVSPKYRWKWYWIEILKQLLDFYENKNSMILETRYDSEFYPISRSLWFENILADKYWYISQYLEKWVDVKTILETIKWNFYKYKEEANNYIKLLNFSPKKAYI